MNLLISGDIFYHIPLQSVVIYDQLSVLRIFQFCSRICLRLHPWISWALADLLLASSNAASIISQVGEFGTCLRTPKNVSVWPFVMFRGGDNLPSYLPLISPFRSSFPRLPHPPCGIHSIFSGIVMMYSISVFILSGDGVRNSFIITQSSLSRRSRSNAVNPRSCPRPLTKNLCPNCSW